MTSEVIFKEFRKQLDIIFEYTYLEQFTKSRRNNFLRLIV